jgi:hypothetical protein
MELSVEVHPLAHWGGFVKELVTLSDYDSNDDLPSFEVLRKIDESKHLLTAKNLAKSLAEEEVNRLNSPVLDVLLSYNAFSNTIKDEMYRDKNLAGFEYLFTKFNRLIPQSSFAISLYFDQHELIKFFRVFYENYTQKPIFSFTSHPGKASIYEVDRNRLHMNTHLDLCSLPNKPKPGDIICYRNEDGPWFNGSTFTIRGSEYPRHVLELDEQKKLIPLGYWHCQNESLNFKDHHLEMLGNIKIIKEKDGAVIGTWYSRNGLTIAIQTTLRFPYTNEIQEFLEIFLGRTVVLVYNPEWTPHPELVKGDYTFYTEINFAGNAGKIKYIQAAASE